MSQLINRLNTLVGRRIVLHEPYYGHSEGTIREQLDLHNTRFGVHLDGYLYNGRPITVDFCRHEFRLVPLPRSERQPEFQDD